MKAPEWAEELLGYCRRKPVRASLNLAMIACGVWVWSWAFDRVPPREAVEGVPAKPAFAPGEMFGGSWRMTINRRCEGKLERWMTSEADPQWRGALPLQGINSNQGITDTTPLPARRTVAVVPFAVPKDAPPDVDPYAPQAAYHLRISFHCNPLHRLFPIVVNYPVIRFKVLGQGDADMGNTHALPQQGQPWP